MICPFCGSNDDKVVDSRSSDSGKAIRRRRECLKCERRFTTYERVDTATRLIVVKRDGSRQTFDPEKTRAGIESACGKRPIPVEQRQLIVEELEDELLRDFDREVPSSEIGHRVADRLRRIDQVAYVRFASVYKQFQSLDQIIEEAKEAKERADAEVPGQAELFPGRANGASSK